ncbi:MAG: flagellar protein FlgN, partial [Gammaproteobacteria bacterium SHHR-1]
MHASTNAFATLIQAEIQTAEDLLGCLRQEQEALRQFSAEALEQAVARKVELLEQMAQHANRRAEYLHSVGCPEQEVERIHAFIQQRAAPALPAWRRLVDLAGELDRQNEINGSMIQLSQQRTQIALDLATPPEDKPRTYGKK